MSHAKLSPFHLAFPVKDIEESRAFYCQVLGCTEGRIDSASPCQWVDFNFFGHQIVAHLAPHEVTRVTTSEVDGKQVPVRHFGVVLEMKDWEATANRLQAAHTPFIIAPHIRFKGEPGEQATLFFYDPSWNAIEIKGFANMAQLFAK